MSKPIRYRTVAGEGQAEITEKKSRFIATVRPVSSEEEALSFIAGMKKKYWNASHNCSAYIVGPERPVARCSDDGEPGQTAGRPMLDVLEAEGLCNVCVVVTRYFGGTLLGTGGLVRAYSAAAKAGLAAGRIIDRRPGYLMSVTCDYALFGKLQYLLSGEGLSCTRIEYTDTVTAEIPVPSEDLERIREAVIQAANARVSLELSEETYLP